MRPSLPFLPPKGLFNPLHPSLPEEKSHGYIYSPISCPLIDEGQTALTNARDKFWKVADVALADVVPLISLSPRIGPKSYDFFPSFPCPFDNLVIDFPIRRLTETMIPLPWF